MSRFCKEGIRVKIKFEGKVILPYELAQRLGLSTQTIWNRLRAGVPYDQLISADQIRWRSNRPPVDVNPPVGEEKETGKIVNFPKSTYLDPLVPIGKKVTPYRLAVAGMISGEEYLALENELKKQKDEDDEVDQYG